MNARAALHIIALSCLCLPFACVQEPVDTLLDRTTLPPTTAEAQADFDFTIAKTLGIKVTNPISEIGFTRADNTAIWAPVNGKKMILSGLLEDYFVHNPSGDEHDWNLRIIPDPDFAFILSEVSPGWVGTVETKPCDQGGTTVGCLYAEVTPDQHFYNNTWFPEKRVVNNAVIDVPSPLKGKKICVYGPWVRDDGHGWWAEIHPTEAIWWKSESTANSDQYHVICLQDDSNRFDTDGDFQSNPGGTWKPWSKPPITSEIRIPFEYDFKHKDHYIIDIEELEARNVVTSTLANSGDSDDLKAHALRLKPARPGAGSIEINAPDDVIVAVNELQSDDFNVGVQFTEISRKADGHIIGYVKITTSYGSEGDDREGYHVLRITVKRPSELIGPGTVFNP